jgi:hypothetical protein
LGVLVWVLGVVVVLVGGWFGLFLVGADLHPIALEVAIHFLLHIGPQRVIDEENGRQKQQQ